MTCHDLWRPARPTHGSVVIQTLLSLVVVVRASHQVMNAAVWIREGKSPQGLANIGAIGYELGMVRGQWFTPRWLAGTAFFHRVFGAGLALLMAHGLA